MQRKRKILVVANRTAASPELVEALHARNERTPASFTILLPAPARDRDAATAELDAAIARITEAALEADGVIGDADPIVAIGETWNPAKFDEVIVSTLPTEASK